jgi:signal transduction histidine kinase
MKALLRDRFFYALCLSLLISVGWQIWLFQIPTDTLTGQGDFSAGQYQLNARVSSDSKWATDGIANYRSILRVDARDVSEWLARALFEADWETAWEVGGAHQYLVERRDEEGKRVISITLQTVSPRDVMQYSGIAVLATLGNVLVALAASLQRPRPPVATPLMLLACASLLNLAWMTFAVPFSYLALRQPFFLQFVLHTVSMALGVGAVVHLALTFPGPLAWFAQRRRLILMGLYGAYPFGLVLIMGLQPGLTDKFVAAAEWELQIGVALKAIAYLIWATQYRQASVNKRAQLHWIFMAITAYDLISMARVFSRGTDLAQLQLLVSLLLPFGYAMAILPGRSLRLTLGSTSGFIHGVANTLTLALFLSGLGLAASLLADSNHAADLPLVTVILSGVFALTTVPLANLLREQFDSWFQGTRSAQRALLYQFTARVSENITLSEVTQAFYDTLDQGVQPAHTALWLWNDEAQGLQRMDASPTLMAVDSSLYAHLLALQTFTPIAQAQLWPDVQAYQGLIALTASGALVGVCAIGPRIDGRNYSGDAIRFFEALTRSATLAFRNAQLVEQMEDKIIALRHAYRQFMTAQEDERQRLASELHDETLQQLAHVNLLAGGLYKSVDEKGGVALKELQGILVFTERRLREILRGVHPAVLTDLGLIPALRSWMPHPEGIAVEMTTQGFEGKRLPDPSLELTLYRLCQESLNNALKHARANRVEVRLMWEGHTVTLEVVDNGVGFEPSVLASKIQAQTGHFGLMNLRERVNALNGQLVIKSQPGSGTLVRALVPLQNGVSEAIREGETNNGA